MQNEAHFKIIDVTQNLIPQIQGLEELCFSVPWTEEMLKSQLTDDRHVFLAAIENERVLGYVGMMYVIDEGYISNVAVDSLFRGKGIAQELIRELINRGNQLDLAFITLEVRKSNIPACSLYEKMGFVEVGVRKNYYERPTEDAILMTLFLKQD